MVAEENAGRLGASCLTWMLVAFATGIGIAVIIWFMVARVDPAAAPNGEGPIEAAEKPDVG
jgi:hypothetical protein